MTFLNNNSFELRFFYYPKFCLFIIFAVLATFISAYMSLDSAAYQYIFHYHSRGGWNSFFEEARVYEAFFVGLAKLLSGWSSLVWFAFIASWSVGLKFLLLQRSSSHFYWSLIFYLTYFFVLFDGTVIRASLGIIIAYWGAWFFSQGRYWLAGLLVALAASCFHYSLAFFFIVVLFNSRRLTWLLIASYPLLVGFWWLGYDFLHLSLDAISDLDSSAMGVGKLRWYLLSIDYDAYPYSIQFIGLYLASVLVYWRYRGELTAFERVCFNCVFMSLAVLALLVGASGVQNRVSEIFRFGLIFIFPYYYRYLLEWVKKPWLATCLMLFALIGYFYYYVILAGLIVWPKAWSLPL